MLTFNRVKEDKDKIFILLLFTFILAVFPTLLSYYSSKKMQKNDYDITRLSQEYMKYSQEQNESLEQKGVFSSEVNNDSKVDTINDNSIEDIVHMIEKLINSNQFDYLLSLYNKEYVENFNINAALLKDNFKFADSVSAKITKIKRDGVDKDRAVVNVRLIAQNNSERMFDFTVFDDGTIADLPLYREINLEDKITERDNVIYKVKKKYITRLGSLYVINIKNNSEVKVDIQDIKGILGDSMEYNHELINGNKFTYQITPEEDITMAVKIHNQDRPDDIIITNKKMDGTIEKFGIWNK